MFSTVCIQCIVLQKAAREEKSLAVFSFFTCRQKKTLYTKRRCADQSRTMTETYTKHLFCINDFSEIVVLCVVARRLHNVRLVLSFE